MQERDGAPASLREPCRCPASHVASSRRDRAPFAGEHLRASLLANGSAGDPRATLEAVVGPGHLHAISGGWAPDACALLQDLQAAPLGRAGAA